MFNLFNLYELAQGDAWHARMIRNRMPYLSERPYDWSFVFEYFIRGDDEATLQADVENVAHAFTAWAPPIIGLRACSVRVDKDFESDKFYGTVRMRGFFEGAKPEGYEAPKHALDLAAIKTSYHDEPVLFGR